MPRPDDEIPQGFEKRSDRWKGQRDRCCRFPTEQRAAGSASLRADGVRRKRGVHRASCRVERSGETCAATIVDYLLPYLLEGIFSDSTDCRNRVVYQEYIDFSALEEGCRAVHCATQAADARRRPLIITRMIRGGRGLERHASMCFPGAVQRPHSGGAHRRPHATHEAVARGRRVHVAGAAGSAGQGPRRLPERPPPRRHRPPWMVAPACIASPAAPGALAPSPPPAAPRTPGSRCCFGRYKTVPWVAALPSQGPARFSFFSLFFPFETFPSSGVPPAFLPPDSLPQHPLLWHWQPVQDG